MISPSSSVTTWAKNLCTLRRCMQGQNKTTFTLIWLIKWLKSDLVPTNSCTYPFPTIFDAQALRGRKATARESRRTNVQISCRITPPTRQASKCIQKSSMPFLLASASNGFPVKDRGWGCRWNRLEVLTYAGSRVNAKECMDWTAGLYRCVGFSGRGVWVPREWARYWSESVTRKANMERLMQKSRI